MALLGVAAAVLVGCAEGASPGASASVSGSAPASEQAPTGGPSSAPASGDAVPSESASAPASDVVVPPPGPAKAEWTAGSGERYSPCSEEQLTQLPEGFATPVASEWSGPYCDEMAGETAFMWAYAQPGDSTTPATDAMAALTSSMIEAGWQSVENNAEDRPQGTVISAVLTTSSGDSQALVAVWSDGKTPATVTLSTSASG